MLNMQIDAFGPSDLRCVVIENKIKMILGQESDSMFTELDDALSKIPSVGTSLSQRPPSKEEPGTSGTRRADFFRWK
jgi:hypothetical protein